MINNSFMEPFWKWLDYYLHDPYLRDMEEFVGGGKGNDWVSKAAKADANK